MNKQGAHTPTPWSVWDKTKIYGPGEEILTEVNNGNLGVEQDKANAAFIVRAVNSHERLIQACRHLLNDLEYRKLDTAGMGYARRAIAQAEGR